ncbi:DNA-directed RNA polymerase subunit H [uncultured archaeon]|nr:DNA-directed RNA polymerase subunit H [uncultured archaeon]
MPDGGKIDVSLNNLVPKHEVISKSEEDKLLEAIGIRKQQLPKLKVTDPQCKLLGAKIGDVVKISRTDMGPNYYYRRVVK